LTSSHLHGITKHTRNRVFRRRQNDENYMKKIVLKFPDGNKRQFKSGITASEVAQTISTSLSKKAISADVDGNHWDLQWAIERDCEISINTIKDEYRAIELIRHDLAHIMARAVQEIWPDVKVTIGPVIENGWYYDFDRQDPFTPEDLGTIEKKMKDIINSRDLVRTECGIEQRQLLIIKRAMSPTR